MAGRKFRNQGIIAYGLHGMNNLPLKPATLVDRYAKATPHIAVNVTVSDDGVMKSRGGYARKAYIPHFHSLWAGTVLLAADANYLYRVDGDEAIPLSSLSGPAEDLRYAEVRDTIYISNQHFNAAYDVKAGVVRTWGTPLPPAPQVAVTTGNLPPGTYTLAYTQVTESGLSGNGALVQVRWEGATRGIALGNLATNYQCWMTEPNGKVLKLATVEGNKITEIPTSEPLLPFMCGPPPKFRDFVFAFGRFWGAKGKRLYYSFPGFPEWFRDGDYRGFQDEIVLLAATNGGIFVNSRTSSWYLGGSDPEKVEVYRCGDGAVPGTLCMARAPASLAGGAATSANFGTLSQMPTPVWLSPTGFVVGTHTGHLTHLTYHRLRLPTRAWGASLFRIKEGIPQIITTLHGPYADEPDPELDQIFNDGRLF